MQSRKPMVFFWFFFCHVKKDFFFNMKLKLNSCQRLTENDGLAYIIFLTSHMSLLITHRSHASFPTTLLTLLNVAFHMSHLHLSKHTGLCVLGIVKWHSLVSYSLIEPMPEGWVVSQAKKTLHSCLLLRELVLIFIHLSLNHSFNELVCICRFCYHKINP